MKAAKFYGQQDIRVEETPDPIPAIGEVLVRVKAAGICGSDLHFYRHGQQRANVQLPLLRGHELAGEIALLGPDVAGLHVGQRVAVEPRHLVGCGHCRWCLRGDYQLCPSRGQVGDRYLNSTGFAEYSLEPEQNVYPLPDGLSVAEAALLDVYSCGVHALHLAPAKPLHTVVIQGAGPVGLATAEVYRLSGAGRVIMCDVLAGPLAVAAQVGADATVNSAATDVVEAVMDLTGGAGADVVVEAVGGMAPTFSADLRMAARGGTVLIVGMYTKAQSLDTFEPQQKELRIVFSNSYGRWEGVPEFRIALDLMAAGKLKPERYITHTFPLDEIAQAFATADDKRTSGAVKVMIAP